VEYEETKLERIVILNKDIEITVNHRQHIKSITLQIITSILAQWIAEDLDLFEQHPRPFHRRGKQSVGYRRESFSLGESSRSKFSSAFRRERIMKIAAPTTSPKKTAPQVMTPINISGLIDELAVASDG
jgi:hypothetical protein